MREWMLSAGKERTSEGDIVVVLRGLDGLEGTTDVELLGGVVQVSNGRMGQIIGTEDLFGLLNLVGLVNIGDCGGKQ